MSAEQSAERAGDGASTSSAPHARMLFVSDTQFESLVSREHAAECAEEAYGCLASLFDLAKPGTHVVFIAARLLTYSSKRGCGDVARVLQLVHRHPSSAHTITKCLDICFLGATRADATFYNARACEVSVHRMLM